jgi:translocator protein
MTRSKQVKGLLGWLALAFAAAATGAMASVQAPTFYRELVRPAWAPAASVFGPVWSLLYCLMGVASWLVWREGRASRVALGVYVLQLSANALWSWLFFVWHNGRLAFVEIIILWVLIATTLILFWRVRPLAGALLLPYLAWVSFASLLAFEVWKLNPRLLG